MRMMRHGVLLLIVAWPIAVRAAQSPEETVSAAIREEKAGSFQAAIELYETFLKEHPDHIQRSVVEYNLALCYDYVGKTELAILHLRESLSTSKDAAVSKQRPDAYMKLARLYADDSKFKQAAETLDAMLKEGPGLYEDEAQSLRAGYLALLGQYDESAVLFNILRNKPAPEIAKEAAYKLGIVWMKSGNTDLAKTAIEDFAKRYPGDPRISDLFLRIAMASFDKRQLKTAMEMCQHILSEFKDAPGAIEAAFVAAVIYRDNGNIEKAIESFVRAAAMPQAAHNSAVASEALFETAQLYRKQLKQLDKAVEYYRATLLKSKEVLTDRHQTIVEQSIYWQADIHYQQERWGEAYDLYAQLRKSGSKLPVIERLLYCKSKMSGGGDVSMELVTDDELAFIRKRITDNPGTLLAIRSETFLIERDFDRVIRGSINSKLTWSAVSPFIGEYAAVLKKYPAEVLAQQDQGAFIKLRQATLYCYVSVENPEFIELTARGVALCEQALAEAPASTFRVEAMENLAFLAGRCGQKRKAFDTYRKLYDIANADPKVAAKRRPSEYLQGLLLVADTPELAAETLTILDTVIAGKDVTTVDGRMARFYQGELLYIQKRFAEAAESFRSFVKTYGPTQNIDGSVSAAWKKPEKLDDQMEQVYDAAQRVAHCWRNQGSTTNMVAAYKWVTENLNHLNFGVAEAWYMSLTAGIDPLALSPPEKEALARKLWTCIVNRSLDMDSKAFSTNYYPWVRDAVALPYVKSAILKTGEYLGEAGKHRLAGDVFRVYTGLYSPFDKKRQLEGKPLYSADDQYQIAAYASGKEYLLDNNYTDMCKQFSVFMEDLRQSRFRIPALMALGHYGTLAEMYAEAAEAYAALLDEYGPSNTLDPFGVPIPVPLEQRLRRQSGWNGVRLPVPKNWDYGKLRFGLGLLQWRKEDWQACEDVLLPFYNDPALKNAQSRPEALFMLARSFIRQGLPTRSLRPLEIITKEHPSFKAIDEVYTELARAALEASEWTMVEDTRKRFVAAFPNSERRPHIEFHAAVAQIGSGNRDAGIATLRSLVKEETFEDVKAGAYYHLALNALQPPKPDLAEAQNLLRKSIECYPQPLALLQASRCACDAKDWTRAKEYVDRFSRDFPNADRRQLDDAQQLRKRIAQDSVGKR